ncbi:hypothetical protein E6C76_20570 [Pseudothauera nasutitermitis]|uniref:Cytochrome C oxidase subunit IV n=1 Tax=Pseudothauera nasutitermitis TaxID=2565930 RepID=A0A4S4APD0_9RHOO|nr:hypothetical protein [Pseudothauera nasutitermitis]THF61476.1 hypothetical protein E6C76_20570 [Pseudothauera nasutitermitis]
MDKNAALPRRPQPNLAWAWCALVGLSALGALLGAAFHEAGWLPAAVALVVWLKGTVVARAFLEERQAHPFIRWVLRLFIAFVPLALLLVAVLGRSAG